MCYIYINYKSSSQDPLFTPPTPLRNHIEKPKCKNHNIIVSGVMYKCVTKTRFCYRRKHCEVVKKQMKLFLFVFDDNVIRDLDIAIFKSNMTHLNSFEQRNSKSDFHSENIFQFFTTCTRK